MVGVGSGFMVGETMQEPISQFLHHYLAQAITTEAYLRSQVYVLPIYRETALVFDQTKAHACLLFQLRQRLSERYNARVYVSIPVLSESQVQLYFRFNFFRPELDRV